MRISDWSSDVCSSDLVALAPFAQQVLHRRVERAATLELHAQAAEHGDIRDAPGEEGRRQQRPVERVVPDDLDRHHLRVAEQRVLVLEQGHGGLVEREVKLLVAVGVRRQVAPGAGGRDKREEEQTYELQSLMR